MKVLIAAIVLGIAAIAVADLFGFTFARAATPSGITVEIARMELRCDGDSTRVSVRARDTNGAPIANADVRLFVTGTVSARGRQFASGEVAGRTDRRGDFHAVVTPTPGTHIRWDIFAKVGDGISYPLAAACDFSPDRTYVLAGSVFADRNGDGVRNRREGDAKHIKMTLSSGYSFGSLVPPHTLRTDRDGGFEWTGLSQDPVPGRSPWRVCLVDAGLAITSMNGAPIAATQCVSTELTPGVTRVVLGVTGIR